MKYENESEIIFHQGEPTEHSDGFFSAGDPDYPNKARHHDNEKTWVVEAYDTGTIRRMTELGATKKDSRIDGGLFVVDAKMLIEFIASSSDLNVEFRNRKRPQLTPENVEKRRLRMAALNAAQRAKI